MEKDIVRRAWWVQPAALLLILNLCGHLDFVRGACNSGEVTPKVLAASLSAYNIYYFKKTSVTGTAEYRHYINYGGSYLDFYDNANPTDCSLTSCYYRMRYHQHGNWHS